MNPIPTSPTNSGGVRVGRRLIGFGDFPEMVDFDLARERAERQRADRRALEESRLRENKSDGNTDWQSQRPRMTDPLPASVQAQMRPSSNAEDNMKNGTEATAKRRRGLSNPEELVGLGIGSVRVSITKTPKAG
jgi:hypothetical protein